MFFKAHTRGWRNRSHQLFTRLSCCCFFLRYIACYYYDVGHLRFTESGLYIVNCRSNVRFGNPDSSALSRMVFDTRSVSAFDGETSHRKEDFTRPAHCRTNICIRLFHGLVCVTCAVSAVSLSWLYFTSLDNLCSQEAFQLSSFPLIWLVNWGRSDSHATSLSQSLSWALLKF